MHLDLEVGPAVAADVALDRQEAALVQDMQLACFIVEVDYSYRMKSP